MGEPRPRTIFFGTPDFAVPVLQALCSVTDVVQVVCQPDRPSGRGMKLQPPPVKVVALERGLPVLQPTRVRTARFASELGALRAELGVVVAYGRILPRAVLDAPRLGCVNVHASLLPRYRGAAPIQWAIAEGDAVTGVCLMQMDEGMDTGPVLACAETGIAPDETAGELAPRLASLGADLLLEKLPDVLAARLLPRPQDGANATLAPLLTKQEGCIDWSRPARRVHDRVRAMHPWPGAYTYLGSTRLKLHRTHVLRSGAIEGAGGEVLRADAGVIEVACGDGAIAIDELQLDGKRRMSASEFLAGRKLKAADRFHEGPT